MDSAKDIDGSMYTEVIRQYDQGAAALRAAWDEAPETSRLFRPDSKSWSAQEIVCHCADSEMNAAIRIRMLVAETEPVIIGYDQDEWARVFTYQDLDPNLAMKLVTQAREWTLPLLMQLTDEQWKRSGTHSESGPYSALDWLNTYSVHLHDHAEQIRTNVRAWNARNNAES